MADVAVLNVLLYGAPIGTLTRVAGDRTLFSFNEDYIADNDRPVLGLGFKDRLGELITDQPMIWSRQFHTSRTQRPRST